MMRACCSLGLLCLLASAPAAFGGEIHRFTYRVATVGEQADQQADFDLNLVKTIEQAQQIIDSEARHVRRKQRLRLTVLETNGQQATRVQITFAAAAQSVAQAGQEAVATPLPVQGKTYIVSRLGDDLLIVDNTGHAPPPEEYAIVATATQTLGRPNPLAKFFNGRTIAVGERLELPPDLAKELLGLGASVGDASKFTLVFRGTQQIEGVTWAEFDTAFEAQSRENSTLSMQMKGRMVLNVATCRAKSLTFSGPVEILETHGPDGGQYQVRTRGTMTMSNQSEHTIRR